MNNIKYKIVISLIMINNFLILYIAPKFFFYKIYLLFLIKFINFFLINE